VWPRPPAFGYQHDWPVGQSKLASALFKALAHPTRLAIIELLRGGELCVCNLEQALGCRQAYVSQQLTVLRDAGIVTVRREGWRIYYRVTQPVVFSLVGLASAVGPERQEQPTLILENAPSC
jgi:DNA-binding transcriptional ArsR family regulator